ncbi:MAG: hypothetical protein BRD55_11675 [Bacteroidetes bacterium SW_9_63_38]|nr:MAG: hypothetical protein BRD55_11675 [Bacteroidetes bacterium SW_9_63_38]
MKSGAQRAFGERRRHENEDVVPLAPDRYALPGLLAEEGRLGRGQLGTEVGVQDGETVHAIHEGVVEGVDDHPTVGLGVGVEEDRYGLVGPQGVADAQQGGLFDRRHREPSIPDASHAFGVRSASSGAWDWSCVSSII